MRSASGLLALTLVGLAALHGAFVLGVISATLGYPFQLEWMEGGTADVVARVLAGKDVYVRPSLDYVAHIYTPLYYYASALVALVARVDFVAPRLVSALSTLMTVVLLWHFLRRQRVGTVLALTGPGLFLATFALSGFWFHLARVDSLCLALVMAAAYGLRFARGDRAAALTGGLAALAVLTKQTALVALAPPLVACLARRTRVGTVALATMLVLVFGVAWVLDARSGGWFRYFVFLLPMLHPADAGLAARLLGDALALPLAIGLVLATLGALLRFRRDPFPLALGAGLLLASVASAAHSGAYLNVVMPAHLAVALLAPLGLSELGRSTQVGTARNLAPLLLAIQLALLVPDPRDALPTDADRQGGERLLAYLANVEGEVLLPHHRFLQTRVGKRSYGLGMAAEDVLRATRANAGTDPLRRDIERAMRERRFAAIVAIDREVPPIVARNYELADTLFAEDDPAYIPVTGAPVRPNYVFVPRP